MTEPTPDNTPLEPTFQQAMEITAQWLALWENGELSDEVMADRVGELVASRDGARGFFVVSLAGDCPLMDRLPDPVVFALRQAGDGVVDLSARNLAMSTAMVLHHQRSGDAGQQAISIEAGRQLVAFFNLLDAQPGKKSDVVGHGASFKTRRRAARGRKCNTIPR